MSKRDLDDFLRNRRDRLRKGPVALVFAEDEVEVASTVRHLRTIGFSNVLLIGAPSTHELGLPDDGVFPIEYDVHAHGALESAVNRVIAAAPGQWIHYCYNAEYLFHPFCESRDIVELLAFHTEERREALLTCVLDLYASDLEAFPNAVSRDTAMFDRTGYYALQRFNGRDSAPMERQLDIFGGIRWRFEEHVPVRSRRIDRISLFRAKPGLQLRSNHTLNDEEMNTYACPWHNNITATVASFRAAKALRHNPGSRSAIKDFTWWGSRRFDWTSQQLMDHGFMEPGQWF